MEHKITQFTYVHFKLCSVLWKSFQKCFSFPVLCKARHRWVRRSVILFRLWPTTCCDILKAIWPGGVERDAGTRNISLSSHHCPVGALGDIFSFLFYQHTWGFFCVFFFSALWAITDSCFPFVELGSMERKHQDYMLHTPFALDSKQHLPCRYTIQTNSSRTVPILPDNVPLVNLLNFNSGL